MDTLEIWLQAPVLFDQSIGYWTGEPDRQALARALAAVPEKYRLFFLLNPLTGVVEGLRSVLVFGREPEWQVVGISAALILTIFVGATILFKSTDKYFADVI